MVFALYCVCVRVYAYALIVFFACCLSRANWKQYVHSKNIGSSSVRVCMLYGPRRNESLLSCITGLQSIHLCICENWLYNSFLQKDKRTRDTHTHMEWVREGVNVTIILLFSAKKKRVSLIMSLCIFVVISWMKTNRKCRLSVENKACVISCTVFPYSYIHTKWL